MWITMYKTMYKYHFTKEFNQSLSYLEDKYDTHKKKKLRLSTEAESSKFMNLTEEFPAIFVMCIHTRTLLMESSMIEKIH